MQIPMFMLQNSPRGYDLQSAGVSVVVQEHVLHALCLDYNKILRGCGYHILASLLLDPSHAVLILKILFGT